MLHGMQTVSFFCSGCLCFGGWWFRWKCFTGWTRSASAWGVRFSLQTLTFVCTREHWRYKLKTWGIKRLCKNVIFEKGKGLKVKSINLPYPWTPKIGGEGHKPILLNPTRSGLKGKGFGWRFWSVGLLSQNRNTRFFKICQSRKVFYSAE